MTIDTSPAALSELADMFDGNYPREVIDALRAVAAEKEAQQTEPTLSGPAILSRNMVAPAVPLPEPLFLLHCGALYNGEQDDWDVEANSGKAVDALAREHPNETVWLHSSYDLHQYAEAHAKAAVVAVYERCVRIIEGYQVPVGNSAAGEMAAEWTMAALREVRDAIRANQKGAV